jgi:radical SAM-linked protein
MNTWKLCRHFDSKHAMRLRITFSKSGALRYTGHLDLQTIWERTVRRAGLPLAYTHGFHPGPRLQIASALPLGFIGRAEIVDIWLQENAEITHETAPGKDMIHSCVDVLQTACPPGLTVVSVEQVDEAGPALQTRVASAEYEVTLLDPVEKDELERRLIETLGVESLLRQRRDKEYYLRPLIEELSVLPAIPPASPSSQGNQYAASQAQGRHRQDLQIFMRLAAREGATARPEAVLEVLGIPLTAARIERTRLILK